MRSALAVCLTLAISTPALADADECTDAKRNRFGQCPYNDDEEFEGGDGFFVGLELRYFATLDLGAGVTFATEGLAYDVQLLPLGVGVELSRPEHTAFIGVATGIGASGAPGALPSAGMIPVQVSTMVRLSKRLNLLSRTRASRLINRTSRDHGSPTISFADELDALLALQWSDEMNYLEGSYVGLAYRELEGARFLGVVFGKGGGEEVFDGYTNAEKEQRAQDRRSR